MLKGFRKVIPFSLAYIRSHPGSNPSHFPTLVLLLLETLIYQAFLRWLCGTHLEIRDSNRSAIKCKGRGVSLEAIQALIAYLGQIQEVRSA